MDRLAFRWLLLGALAASSALLAQSPGRAQLPDGAGRDTVKRICAGCHPAEVVLGKGLTREQWGSLVSNMVSRGARGTDEEFAEVVDYLTKNLPPQSASVPTAGPGMPAPAAPPKKRSGGLLDQAGAADKHIVDDAAADRGKSIYVAQCITCHGTKARGSNQGSDLVRSLVVLKDRYGSTIGPYLAKGHPMQSGQPSSSLTKEQVEDLSHFLHQRVGDTLRTGPYNTVLNVLTGDPKAGKAYFDGPGKCSTCHSATGDLAGISKKYEPAVLQLKMIFPQTVAFGKRASTSGRKPTTVTVTTPSGEQVNGVLLQLDDFDVALRDGAGEYRAFKRTPELKVEKHDPYLAHEELLDHYTDKNMHDLVAYLETLK